MVWRGTEPEILLELLEGNSLNGVVYSGSEDYRLVPGARIDARQALDADADPIQRAATTLFPLTAVTNAEGRYELSGLPSGSLLVQARLDGYCGEARRVDLPSPESIDFVLIFGGTISGRLVDAETQRPLETACVSTAQTLGDGKQYEGEVEFTDANGDYSIWAPSVDGSTLVAAYDGFASVVVPLPRLAHQERRRVDIALPAAGKPVVGRAHSITGEPVSATVRCYEEPSLTRIGRVYADAQGRFEIDCLRTDKTYRLVASDSDYKSNTITSVSASLDSPTEIDMPMLPLARVRGVVLHDSEPVAGGQIRLMGKDPDDKTALSEYTTIGDDGAFEFTGLDVSDTASYALLAIVDGHAPTSLAIEIDPPRTDEVVHEIEVHDGMPLEGRLIDDTTGAPIVGATLQPYEVDLAGRMREVLRVYEKSDESGQFRFDAFPQSTEAMGVLVDHASYSIHVERLPARLSAVEQPLEIRVPPSATLELGVFLADSSPALRWDCRVSAPGRATSIHRHSKTPTGFFRMDRFIAGVWRLSIEILDDPTDPSAIGTRLYRDVELIAGEVRTERFDLAEHATIRGRVHSEEMSLAGRDVQVFALPTTGGPYVCKATANQLGEFTLKGVPSGEHWIRAESLDGEPRLVAQTRLLVSPGGAHEIELSFDAGGTHGVIVDRRDRPIPDATVRLLPTDHTLPRDVAIKTVTGEGGRFAIAGMKPGVWTVEVEASGFGKHEESILVGLLADATDLRIVLVEAATLRVTTAGSDGKPLRPSSARALLDVEGATAQASTLIDDDGHHVFDDLTEGTYAVTAEASGHFPANAHVDLIAGEIRDVRLTLRRPGSLHLTLKAAAGRPLVGEPFDVVDDLTGESASDWLAKGWISTDTASVGALVTGEHGEVVIRGLPAGRHTLHALGLTRTVEVLAGEVVKKTVMALP